MARQAFETRRPAAKMMGSEAQFVRRPLPPAPANISYSDKGIPYVTTRQGIELPVGVGCFHAANDWSGQCTKPSCDVNEAALAALWKLWDEPRESEHGPA